MSTQGRFGCCGESGNSTFRDNQCREEIRYIFESWSVDSDDASETCHQFLSFRPIS